MINWQAAAPAPTNETRRKQANGRDNEAYCSGGAAGGAAHRLGVVAHDALAKVVGHGCDEVQEVHEPRASAASPAAAAAAAAGGGGAGSGAQGRNVEHVDLPHGTGAHTHFKQNKKQGNRRVDQDQGFQC